MLSLSLRGERPARRVGRVLAGVILATAIGPVAALFSPAWGQLEIASHAQIPKEPCYRDKDFTIVQNGTYYESFFIRVNRTLEGDTSKTRWSQHYDSNTFGHARSYGNIWNWSLTSPVSL